MRWLCATVCLLSVSAGLIAWVYLRDRDPSSWRPPEGQLARVDARATLAALQGPDCRRGCASELLGRIQTDRWLARVTIRGHAQCVQIDLDTFASSELHGLSGVQPSRCTVTHRPT
jgi:hypothetical protein